MANAPSEITNELEIVKKRIEENKHTKVLLQKTSDLITAVRNGYAVMDRPWSKDHTTLWNFLKTGPVDVLSADFVVLIKSLSEQLQVAYDTPFGLTGYSFDDFLEVASLREGAKTLAQQVLEWGVDFLKDHAKLSQTFPLVDYIVLNVRLYTGQLREIDNLLLAVNDTHTELNFIIATEQQKLKGNWKNNHSTLFSATNVLPAKDQDTAPTSRSTLGSTPSM